MESGMTPGIGGSGGVGQPSTGPQQEPVVAKAFDNFIANQQRFNALLSHLRSNMDRICGGPLAAPASDGANLEGFDSTPPPRAGLVGRLLDITDTQSAQLDELSHQLTRLFDQI